MLDDLHRLFFHHLILLVILSSGLLFFLLSSHNPQLQLRIIILVLLAYILWGVFYHYFERNLTFFVFFEYVLVATVAFVIIFSLLKFA